MALTPGRDATDIGMALYIALLSAIPGRAIGWTVNPEPVGGGGRAAHTTTRDLRTMVRDCLEAMGGRRDKLPDPRFRSPAGAPSSPPPSA